MATIIKVPTIGRIIVRFCDSERTDVFGRRDYHRVTFDRSKFGGTTFDLSIGQPPNTRSSLYATVCAAMSHADCPGDGTDNDMDGFVSVTEIPVGTVEVTRDQYHVIGDGVTSWRTDGTQRRKTIKVGRGYEESAMVAVMRHLHDWSGWKDAGTFDSIDPRDTTWNTVPVESAPVRYPGAPGDGMGIPCVEHRITFSGELAFWTEDMALEATRAGVAWR